MTTPEEITKRLVSMESVSPSKGESRVAEEIVRHFSGLGVESKTIRMRDDGRKLAFALIRGNNKGSSKKALLLFGHTDTVGVEDYGELSSVAFDPDNVGRALTKEGLEKAAIKDLKTGRWMAGRGALDMKSGIAVELAVMSHLNSRELGGTIVFLGTPDEEYNSAGIMEGLKVLESLSKNEGIEFIGAINADYTTSRFSGDNNRYAYLGTIGKLLPSFYVVGEASHVGEAFSGLDANLVSSELTRLIDLNPDLCDSAGGEVTVPPVLLKQEDLKCSYNVQTAFSSRQYFNFFTHRMTPNRVLSKLGQKAREAAGNVSELVAKNYSGYMRKQGKKRRRAKIMKKIEGFEKLPFSHSMHAKLASFAVRWQFRQELLREPHQNPLEGFDHHKKRGYPKPSISVIPYSRIHSLASGKIGRARVEKIIRTICANESEGRAASLRIVEALWSHSGLKGPAIVLYFSPPYYPHSFINESESRKNPFVKSAIEVSKAFGLTVRKFYPYISDASYLRLAAGSAEGLSENMPQWGTGYSLPVREMERLNVPVINLGPWGRDAHKRTERVYMPYSFGTLPKIMEQVIRKTFETP